MNNFEQAHPSYMQKTTALKNAAYTQKKEVNIIALLFMSIMVLNTIMPVVSRVISETVTTYALLAVMGFLYLIFFFGEKKQGEACLKALAACMPLLLLEFFNQLKSGNTSIVLWAYQWLLTLLPIFMGIYLIYNSRKFAISIGKLYFAAFFITVVTSIIGLYQNPFAARFLATVSDAGDSYFISLNWKNIGGYAFVYMTVLLYPMVIGLFKQKKMKAWQMAVVVILLAWLYIKAEYVTAILLFVLSSSLLFAKRELKLKTIIWVSLGAGIFYLVFSSYIADLFYYLSDSAASLTISERFQYIADTLMGKDTGSLVGNRSELLRKSFDLFLQSPFIGNFLSNSTPGGHSFVLDTLARFGLLGMGALAILYRSIYKLFYRPYRDQPYYGYMAFSFIQAFMLSVINTGNWMFVLAMGIPLIVKIMETKTMGGVEASNENLVGYKYFHAGNE